jgi:hypothetical protein
MPTKSDRKPLIVKLTSYAGVNTTLSVQPDPLFMVVDSETGKELDNGYTSWADAVRYWPEAINKDL